MFQVKEINIFQSVSLHNWSYFSLYYILCNVFLNHIINIIIHLGLVFVLYCCDWKCERNSLTFAYRSLLEWNISLVWIKIKNSIWTTMHIFHGNLNSQKQIEMQITFTFLKLLNNIQGKYCANILARSPPQNAWEVVKNVWSFKGPL